jgi:hypothetical protein
MAMTDPGVLLSPVDSGLGLCALQIVGIHLRQIFWRQIVRPGAAPHRGRAGRKKTPSMSCFTSSFQGHALPLRSPQHRPSRAASQQQLQVHAVATGPRPQDRPLDVNGSKAATEDAFEKLVALSNKQSVNRPQNVGGVTACIGFRKSRCIDCRQRTISAYARCHDR